MRLILAFQCFFLILFGKKLPEKAAPYFPEKEPVKELPPAEAKPAEPKKEEKKPQTQTSSAPATKVAGANADGALSLLALFQREGRLVDFLREDLAGHGDDAIGAAARDVHRGCKKVLETHFGFEPVLPGGEDAPVTVPKGFDPAEIRLVGETRGEPPFKGTLRHHGWRATQVKLPGLADGVDRTVVAPAEVEV